MDRDATCPRPFRFIDLPLEIRNGVYNVLLCSPPPPNLRPLEYEDLLRDPTGLAYIDHPPETQILRVSRQIHAEARDAMLRGNQFIRVITCGANTCKTVWSLMLGRQIPVVRTTALARVSFRGFAMTHFMDRPGDHPDPYWEPRGDFVILRRDLDEFCKTLDYGIREYKGFDVTTQHAVMVHDPFDKTLSPEFLGQKNQERLLQPYRDHWHGFTRFLVHGAVEAGLADSLRQSVAEEDVCSPRDIIDQMRRNKDLGNWHFKQGSFHEAAKAYASCYNQALRTRARNSWATVKAAGGPEFIRPFAELFYQAKLNAAHNILTYARDGPELSSETIQTLSIKADEHLQDAEDMAWNILDHEPHWLPTLAQMAKLSFRRAIACRIVGELDLAKSYLDTARLQAPSDPVIRHEAEEIEGLLRSQAGSGRLLL